MKLRLLLILLFLISDLSQARPICYDANGVGHNEEDYGKPGVVSETIHWVDGVNVGRHYRGDIRHNPNPCVKASVIPSNPSNPFVEASDPVSSVVDTSAPAPVASVPETEISTPPVDPDAQPVGRVGPRSCPVGINIVDVVKERNPSRVYLTVRNNSGRFQSLDRVVVRLSDSDGKVKMQRRLRGSLTYQRARGQQHTDRIIALYPYRKAFLTAERSDLEILRILFPYNAPRAGGYRDGDVFSLWCDGKEMSRFPESVLMSPRLRRNVATRWGALKRHRVVGAGF